MELITDLYNRYPNIEIEEDFQHKILRVTNAIYLDVNVIREMGMAFQIDKVIKPYTIIYHIGEYDDMWEVDAEGNKNELIDSDLSFSSSGDVEEVMKQLQTTSIGKDGRPYKEID